jgi:hypothetical protein
MMGELISLTLKMHAVPGGSATRILPARCCTDNFTVVGGG